MKVSLQVGKMPTIFGSLILSSSILAMIYVEYIVNLLFFFLQFYYLFIYLFIFGCVGSSFLCKGFLQLRKAGATLHRGARASQYRGLSCCGAQAPDAQAQQLWLTGLDAPRHVGSSQIRARTRVPCMAGRFSTTAPPGKPLNLLLILKLFNIENCNAIKNQKGFSMYEEY